MTEKIKKVVYLFPQPHLLFEILREYWSKKGAGVKTFLNVDEIMGMSSQLFFNAGFNSSSRQTIRNALIELLYAGILKRQKRKATRGRAGRILVEFNWKFFNTHDVARKTRADNSSAVKKNQKKNTGGGADMNEQGKRIISLNLSPFTFFKVLMEYWGEFCSGEKDEKPALSLKEVEVLSKRPFARLQRQNTFMTVRNNMARLVKIGILTQDPEKWVGGRGKLTFMLNREFLKQHEVICKRDMSVSGDYPETEPPPSYADADGNIKIPAIHFAVFNALQEYWNGKNSASKKYLHMQDIEKLVRPTLNNLGLKDNPNTLCNAVRDLEKIKILSRMPLAEKPDGRGRILVRLNQEFLEKHHVLLKNPKRNGKKEVDTLSPSKNDEGEENSSGESELNVPRLRIMLARPSRADKRTQGMRMSDMYLSEEDNQSRFKIICIKNCILGLNEFKGSAPDCALSAMFYDGSNLEVVFKEKAGIKTVSITARDVMDCTLDDEEMKIDHEYVIEPGDPHMLVIDDIYYVVRALGFK